MLGSNEVLLLVKNMYYTSISFSEDVSTLRDYFCPTKIKHLVVREDESTSNKKEDVKSLQEMYIIYKQNCNMLGSQHAL